LKQLFSLFLRDLQLDPKLLSDSNWRANRCGGLNATIVREIGLEAATRSDILV
jgi:hypothetical protein